MSESSSIKTILILSANPAGTVPLRLDQEVRQIKDGLKRSKHRDRFRLEQAEAVNAIDLQRAMLDFNPQIVHFCGHGEEEGIILENGAGEAAFVDAEALADTFSFFETQVECVLLNACYSAVQAEAIVHHIDSVIGMSQAVGDRAAIDFAVSFYDALGAGRPIDFAHRWGCNALKLKQRRKSDGSSAANIPVLHRKASPVEVGKSAVYVPTTVKPARIFISY
ncbi:MAG: CHAT domain-containing protein [Elainellaceae cyanobacterium]